jgi:hypothetical protein
MTVAATADDCDDAVAAAAEADAVVAGKCSRRRRGVRFPEVTSDS